MNDQKGTLRLTTTMVLLVGVLGLLAAQQLAGRQRCQIEALKKNTHQQRLPNGGEDHSAGSIECWQARARQRSSEQIRLSRGATIEGEKGEKLDGRWQMKRILNGQEPS